MVEFLKWFFRFGDDLPSGEGAYSPLHLICVSVYMVSMVVLAILLGVWARKKSDKTKNKVLVWSAILIDGFEAIKIVITGVKDPSGLLHVLPLFLCSIQLVTIPLAAFTKGRLKEVALDFVCVFGILGAITGTVGAAQNYSAYPALSFPNVVSGITHSISGFASLYIIISGMASMKWKNVALSLGIMGGVALIAYGTNLLIDYNYMFLMYHDGTPYSIFWDLLGGNPILYALCVVLLFVVYLLLFFLVYNLIAKKGKANAAEVAPSVQAAEETPLQEAAAADADDDYHF